MRKILIVLSLILVVEVFASTDAGIGIFNAGDTITIQRTCHDTVGENLAFPDSSWFKWYWKGVIIDSSDSYDSLSTGVICKKLTVSDTVGQFTASVLVYNGGKTAGSDYYWQVIGGGLFALGDTGKAQAKGFLTEDDTTKCQTKGFITDTTACQAKNFLTEADTSSCQSKGFAVSGDAMTLTVAERQAIGDTVDNRICDEAIQDSFSVVIHKTDTTILTRDAVWTDVKAGHLDKDISAIDDNPWDAGTRSLTDKAGFSLSSAGNVAISDSILKDSLSYQAKGYTVSGDAMSLTTGERQAVRDTIKNSKNEFKADVSNLALQTEVQNIDGWNPVSDSVLTKNPSAYQSDVSNLDVAVSTRIAKTDIADSSLVQESDSTDFQSKGFAVSGDAMTLTTDERKAIRDTILNSKDEFKASGYSTHSASDVDDVISEEAIQDSINRVLAEKDEYKADVSNLDVAVSTRSSHSASDVDNLISDEAIIDSFGNIMHKSDIEDSSLVQDNDSTDFQAKGFLTPDDTTDCQAKSVEVTISGADAKQIADTTDRVLTSAHGSGDWLSGGISGSKSVTLYVKNTQDSLAIYECNVNILNYAGNLLGIESSNASGMIFFNADTGTYRFQKKKYGVSFPEDTIVVTGDLIDTLWGTTFLPPTPSSGALCAVYGYIYDASGNPIKNEINAVKARISDYPLWIDSVGIVISYKEVDTDTLGYFNIELYRTGQYLLQIPLMGYKKNVTIPNTGSVNFKNLE